MKTVLLLVLACLYTFLTAQAQDPNLDPLMTRHVVDCYDIAYNCQEAVTRYAQLPTTDSLWSVLKYWVEKCGENEKNRRLEILLKLKEKKFNETTYQHNLLELLLTYKDTISRYSQLNNTPFKSHFFHNNRHYDAFTAEYARAIKYAYAPNTLEYLLCEYYSNNREPLIYALKHNRIPETFLSKEYNKRYINFGSTNYWQQRFGLITEYWIPRRGASVLGNHPGLGLQAGWKRNKFLVDLSVLFRLGKARNPYTVFSQDSLMTTNRFSGYCAGLDFGQELARSEKSELDLLCGLSLDGFEAIKKDSLAGIDPVFISSLNVSIGLGYRYHYSKKRYVAFETRIHGVNYVTNGGTDLNGHTVSLRLVWCISSNYKTRGNLYKRGL